MAPMGFQVRMTDTTPSKDLLWPDLAGRIVDDEAARHHVLPIRVYFEDTDAGGIAYHASYVRWCERGRTDFLRLLGTDARRLIDGSAASDSFAVVRFNDEVRINCPLTTAREKLARCVDGIRAHGSQTKLYAAVYDSIDLLGVEGVGPRAVVVFTDGKDEGSGLESGDLVALARENSVPVHVVAVKPGRESRRLERLARPCQGTLEGGFHAD